jgi:hypothetical protein
LTDDGPHGQLESVHRPGDPATGMRRHQRADHRVRPQNFEDGDGIGVEIEQLAAARHG